MDKLSKKILLSQLFEDHRSRLDWRWEVCQGVEREISLKDHSSYGSELIGYVNIIHPRRLHLIGPHEVHWIENNSEAKVKRILSDILAVHPPAFVVASGLKPPELLHNLCLANQTPIITTPKPCAAVMDIVRRYLARHLADGQTIHGVMMDVFGVGVLITGDSGAGKSELALELISRGHGLVADDITELLRIGPDTIEARCPAMTNNFLEVRGLGFLNIRTIYGETACRRKMSLRLIVHLMRPVPGEEIQRLPMEQLTQVILDVPITKVLLPVAAGRNLAVLLEAAVRNSILKMRGIDGMQEFIARQQEVMQAEAMLDSGDLLE